MKFPKMRRQNERPPKAAMANPSAALRVWPRAVLVLGILATIARSGFIAYGFVKLIVWAL
jgi:hypothetical protein